MLSKIAKKVPNFFKNTKLPVYSRGFSTLKDDKNTSEQNQNQQNNNEDQQQQNSEKKGRTSKADEENESISNKKEKINYTWQGYRLFVWTNIALLSYNLYLVNNKDKPEEETGAIGFYMDGAKYLTRNYKETIDFFTKPVRKELLQDIPFVPPGMDPPKTIVLNLTGTLIHSSYVFGKGTEIQKRPGLQKFLRSLAGQYEVVIFTDDDTMFTMDLGEKLDPTHQIFVGRFGRESMSYEGGQYIKDLRYLNRDLSRVVVIEKNPNVLKYHQDNAIYLPEFTGDSEDKQLFKLIPFLQHLGGQTVKDVRKEIAQYGNHDPSEKFLEELKLKQETLQRKQSSGIPGMFSQQKSQNYAAQYKH